MNVWLQSGSSRDSAGILVPWDYCRLRIARQRLILLGLARVDLSNPFIKLTFFFHDVVVFLKIELFFFAMKFL